MMPRWIHRVFHNDAEDQRLEAELRFHLEEQIAANVEAGMNPEEARRQAQIVLGGLEQVKQKTRDVHWENWIENIGRDLRFAMRSLSKDRRVALTVIFTLALGIGAATVSFSVFYNLLYNAFAARDAHRLAVPSIERSGVEAFPLTRSFAVFQSIREQNHAFEDMVAYFHRRILLDDGHQVRQFNIAYLTPNGLEFYGVPPLLGRGIRREDGTFGASPVFVISYKAWIGEFNADTDILGKNFTVDGESRTLIGIMPPRFNAYGATEQLWAPINPEATASLQLRPDIFLLGRLRPGVSLKAAAADLDVVLRRLANAQPDEFPKHFTTRVQSATDYFLGPWGIGPSDDSVFNLKHMLESLLAAGMILLLIACANVANLLLARATVREKEIAVRAALGATRERLAQQLLIESLVLAAAACAAGCVLAFFGTQAASAMLPQKGSGVGGEAVIGLDHHVLLFAFGVTILTTLTCGLAPALHAARRNLQVQLGGSGKGTGAGFRHGRLRSILAISEVVLSVVLLIGAALMTRSFFLITHIDLGFNPNKLVLAAFGHPQESHSTPEQDEILLRTATQRLKELPGVSEVAINNSIPGYNGGFESEVAAPATEYSERSKVDQCSESALRTLEMHLARGRWFSDSDIRSKRNVVVINETLERKFFGNRDPVGQRLEVKSFEESSMARDPNFEIVGVVNDIKNQGPERAVMPQIFIPFEGSGILFLRTSVNPSSMLHAMQQQVWSVDKDVVFGDFYTLNDLLRTLTYSAPEFGLAALSSLAYLALFLLIAGVFSVLAYTVSLQTHDIGIRLALGAQQGDILRMVLKKGLALIVAGVVIGVGVSLGLTRLIASQLWGVSPTDPWTFAGVVMCVVLAGLTACWLPARRATQVDPAVTLRYE